MKISTGITVCILLLLTVEGRAETSAKRQAEKKEIKNEINEAADDVKEGRAERAKVQAKRRETVQNATSVQEQFSTADKETFKRSIPSLTKKVKANPGDSKAQLQLGIAFLITKDFERASEHLKEASQVPSAATLYYLAEAYRGKADYLNEIRTLDVIAKMNEKDAKANELLGRAYYNTKNVEKSAAYFRKAIELDPRRRAAYQGMLKLFEGKKNRYESRQVYQDMLKAFGDDEEAYTGLCRLFTEDSFSDSAIENCLKAIEINPEIPDNHVYLGMSYNFIKDTAQATKILVNAAKQFPKSELAQFAAGQLGDDLKNWESAKLYYRKCVAVDPESGRCYKRLALIAFELKDYDESLKAFIKSCRLDKTTLTEIRNATTKLRIQNKTEWTDKFQHASDKCGI